MRMRCKGGSWLACDEASQSPQCNCRSPQVAFTKAPLGNVVDRARQTPLPTITLPSETSFHEKTVQPLPVDPHRRRTAQCARHGCGTGLLQSHTHGRCQLD